MLTQNIIEKWHIVQLWCICTSLRDDLVLSLQFWTSWRSCWVIWRLMLRGCPPCCPGSLRYPPGYRCLSGASSADSRAGATSHLHSRSASGPDQWLQFTTVWVYHSNQLFFNSRLCVLQFSCIQIYLYKVSLVLVWFSVPKPVTIYFRLFSILYYFHCK